MHIGTNNPKFEYFMRNTKLEVVTEEKDLGVLITNNLKPSGHCDKVAGKANKMLGLIKRTITNKNEETIIKLYKALVRPHLEYAQQFWSPYQDNDIEKIEKVQHRATKCIPRLRHMYYEDRIRDIDLFSLKKRRLRGDLIELFKIVTNKSGISFEKYFRYEHCTRGHILKLKQKRFKNKAKENFFFVRVVKPWNQLSQSTVLSTSLEQFKNRVDRDFRIRGII